MGDTLEPTLVHLSQLRHYGTKVQDNQMSQIPLSIITEDGEFSMELSTEGTIVFYNTHTTSDKKLLEYPCINLSSPHPWYRMKSCFTKCSRSLEEEVGGLQYIRVVLTVSDITSCTLKYDLDYTISFWS